jgi:hypothetical protein
MKLNKAEATAKIHAMADKHTSPCVKLPLQNIVFPKWSDLGLLGMIFAQKIKTKEQPLGCDYDEAVYQVVMRVINGKVLMTGGRPDAYTWRQSKVEDVLSDPSKIRLIGTNSAAGLVALSEILATIADADERMIFADMFCNLKKDRLLVKTDAEERRCIEVTQDLFDAGLTVCVDSWMTPDENGEAEATQLSVGDFLIVEKDGSVYCVRRDEFAETHSVSA